MLNQWLLKLNSNEDVKAQMLLVHDMYRSIVTHLSATRFTIANSRPE